MIQSLFLRGQVLVIEYRAIVRHFTTNLQQNCFIWSSISNFAFHSPYERLLASYSLEKYAHMSCGACAGATWLQAQQIVVLLIDKKQPLAHVSPKIILLVLMFISTCANFLQSSLQPTPGPTLTNLTGRFEETVLYVCCCFLMMYTLSLYLHVVYVCLIIVHLPFIRSFFIHL